MEKIWNYKTEQPKIGKDLELQNRHGVRQKRIVSDIGREQELVSRVQTTHTHAIDRLGLFLR